MAKKEHLQILKQGMEAWNGWRAKDVRWRPQLRRASLCNISLRRVNFSMANLRYANLRGSDLFMADFSGAFLRGADLRDTNLHAADLSYADFSEANLSNANLKFAVLRNTGLDYAILENATIGSNSLDDLDLSRTIGLETVNHRFPSTVGIDTIYKSRGEISEKFLRGCGLPDSFITHINSLVVALEPIQFYSCFISYRSKDQEFANRLYRDLQDEGIRCWFSPSDLKIGDVFRDIIDMSIKSHDKLLVIISENSVSSNWVRDEVESALERERKEKRTVLFPIQIDDAVTNIEIGWAASIRRTRHIGDFRRKDSDAYQKSFERLLHDLKAERSR